MYLDKKFTVSVLMSTYNHCEFIETAINSILMQKCNFNVELIIADDFSTDNTQEIVNNVINKHNNGSWIKYTKHTINKGAYSNALWILNQAKNKYIALCEGDDYWTDPYKLQKQVDFLENNNEFNICYHDVFILNKKGNLKKDFINKTQKKISSKFDLAVWGNYIHTCSVVVRNNNFLENFDSEIYICDYISYMYFVNDGKIKKIEETMAVYRYGDGIWSNSSNTEKQKFIIDNIHNILKTTDDDTIKEIMKMRLNSIELFYLPKYLTKIENTSDRSVSFLINEKIPISIIFSLIIKKIILKIKLFLK
jgi:glycosyltransferase involved in cell wall biosynthesis